MSSGFSEKQDLLVLLSVAGSQNVPQVDLILYLPSTYPDILENGKKNLRRQTYSDTSGQGLS